MAAGYLQANRLLGNGRDAVTVAKAGSARRTCHRILHVAADVTIGDRSSGILSCLHGPLLNGSIYFRKIVNAGIHLGGRARSDEVWNGDGRQQSNDGNDDHDLHQCEAVCGGYPCFHKTLIVLQNGKSAKAVKLKVGKSRWKCVPNFTDMRGLDTKNATNQAKPLVGTTRLAPLPFLETFEASQGKDSVTYISQSVDLNFTSLTLPGHGRSDETK